MKRYKCIVSIPIFVEVEAESPEDAKNQIFNSLVGSKQIKPGDPIEIKVVETDA